MYLKDFNELDIQEKSIALFDTGEFIAFREYYAHRVCLYSMKGFLVEVHYSSGTNQIDKIETVTDDQTLSLYLNDIELRKFL